MQLPDMSEAPYELTAEQCDQFPKYFARDDGECWKDGTVYIVAESENGGIRGVGRNLQTLWTSPLSYALMSRWAWSRSQVSPMYAAALLSYHNHR